MSKNKTIIVRKSEKAFAGDEKDKSGKIHHISRTTCTICKKILSEYHIACCGHDSKGWYSTERHEH